jgi:hypothetical protein
LLYNLDRVEAPNFIKTVMDPLIKKVVGGKVEPFPAQTFRPCQGMTFVNTFVDFVKSTNYLAITNSDARVAFSRHKNFLMFSHVPKYDVNWFSSNYDFFVQRTVRQNYAAFIANINPRAGFNFNLDHHGDHALKWRFFVWMLEYWVAYHKLGDVTSTVFHQLSTLRPTRGCTLDTLMRQAGSDKRKYDVAMELLVADPFVHVKPGTFSDYGWEVKFERNKAWRVEQELANFIVISYGQCIDDRRLYDAALCAGFDVDYSDFRRVLSTTSVAGLVPLTKSVAEVYRCNLLKGIVMPKPC